MDKNFLFSICLILVAIVGFGCVSAADNTTTSIDDVNQMTVNQNVEHNDMGEINNTVSEINEKESIDSNNLTAILH